jgi:hypothetical protein
MAILKLEPNKLYTIALKYPTGKSCVNQFGGEQLRWILSNGDLLYTPLIVGPQIEDLGIKPGQKFALDSREKRQQKRSSIRSTHRLQLGQYLPLRADLEWQHLALSRAACALDGL